MSLFPPNIIDQIKKSAYWADRTIRSDLSLGYIADENDYTSNFTAEFRRQINGKALNGVTATSYKINGSLERKTGTDACIILANKTHAKICLFEAKLPRLSTKKNAWDSIQKSTNKSHFSSQIKRQHKYKHNFTIWEMFYCDEAFTKQSSPFLDYTSTCITHDDAYDFDSKRIKVKKPWSDSELKKLHKQSTIYEVDELIELVCSCSIGQPISYESTKGLLSELQRTVYVTEIKFNKVNDE